MGAVSGPFDAWLVLRGIKTLGVRMDRHCANAERVVRVPHRAPGGRRRCSTRACRSTRNHEVAARQMTGFGGMVSFRMRGGEEAALKVCGLTELFTLAESLGGVESLIEHPGRMTHASVAGSPLEVPADLVRLSVGIENIEDLLADLQRGAGLRRRHEPAGEDRPTVTAGARGECGIAGSRRTGWRRRAWPASGWSRWPPGRVGRLRPDWTCCRRRARHARAPSVEHRRN